MKWTQIYSGQIEGRPVVIERFSEGDIRVHTAQGNDDPGTIISDETSFAAMPPTEKGRKIEIEGSTSEIIDQLKVEGFSDEAIKEITSQF